MRKILFIIFASVLTCSCFSNPFIDKPFPRNDVRRSYMGYKYSFVQKDAIKGIVVKRHKVIQRSYKLREQRVAMLGSPMAQVRAFVREIHRTRRVSPNKDITLVGGANEIKLYKNQSYDIIGSAKHGDVVKGAVYDIIKATTIDGVLFDIDGKISKKVIRLDNKEPVPLSYDFAVRPSDARIVPAEKDQIINKPSELDFELRYDGISGDNFFVTYISFNPMKGRDAGSFETFSYNKDKAKIINIAGMSIKILAVNKEKIDFVIIDDGGLSSQAHEKLEKKHYMTKRDRGYKEERKSMRSMRHPVIPNSYNPAYPYMQIPAPMERQPIAPPVECCVKFDNKR